VVPQPLCSPDVSPADFILFESIEEIQEKEQGT
jgi:hypothetical protein